MRTVAVWAIVIALAAAHASATPGAEEDEPGLARRVCAVAEAINGANMDKCLGLAEMLRAQLGEERAAFVAGIRAARMAESERAEVIRDIRMVVGGVVGALHAELEYLTEGDRVRDR